MDEPANDPTRAASSEPLLPDGMPMEFILDPAHWCDIENGDQPAQHANPDDYRLECLIDMYNHVDCPLHITPEYPIVPWGVWARQFNQATDELDRITRGHGIDPEAGRVHEFCATPAELRDVWERWPHARWAFEEAATEGRLVIRVLED